MTTILIADNNKKWRKVFVKFLKNNTDYTLVEAPTYSEAKVALIAESFDVAVIDIHMTDDQDSKDISGLQLAKLYALGKTKIITTGDPDPMPLFFEALRGIKGLPAGIDFVLKKDGLSQYLIAIERALANPPDVGTIAEPVFGAPGMTDEYQCDVFVMMPFQNDFKPVWDVIDSLEEECGLKIVRGDSLYDPSQDIIHKIWSFTYNCKVVIVDCTGGNPNVLYELGIAHTLGRPAILLTQDPPGIIPFDVRWRDFIIYQNEMGADAALKADLKTILQGLGLCPD
jgi:CheY-like chemotaxis protein